MLSILTSHKQVIMMPSMRTTLTIEPDVAQLLRREIRRSDKSMKAVVNDALRIGLGLRGKSSPMARYEVKPHSFGFKPGIDINRLNQLVDELEAEELGRKSRQ